MRFPGRSRLPFLLATALIAGGLGDPLVETIGDTGVFGAGYHDTNHLGVLPALICGFVLAVEIALLRCAQTLRHTPHDGDWLRALTTRIGSRTPLGDLPYVFVLQLGVVFAIETFEAMLAAGKPVSGTAWLGGPIAFSLALYALIALAVTFAIAWLMRGIATAFVSLVGIAIAFIAFEPPRDGAAALHERHDGTPFSRQQSPHARQLGERAPPLLPAFAP